ncbi:S26 family signal peptidase [Lacisediminihabitans changchengi]|uniref:S26 family signal peptidase n=1 Tax=Lacisediminihabitans changchengi TaxID=2787634 RepID=A0A934W1Z1_9MICO|nr:S26 family signal peptidase [Lacisediminihabitans changchengi]MBK4347373.1 S26 family signal peptidase [Lacisediminihabitans changchengi]
MMTTASLTREWTVPQGRHSARRQLRIRSLITWALSGLAILLVALALAFLATGGRWFIVQTPSMGEVAPVGTLILDAPTTAQHVAVGDIVTFHPPTNPSQVYTHRVVSIAADGALSTKGDVNGAIDPWSLSDKDLIGKTFAVLPVFGWVIRAVPFVAAGFVVSWLLSFAFRSPSARSAVRVIGLSVTTAVTAFVLHPFVGVVVETSRLTAKGAEATLVSTGILPITVSAVGGGHVSLASGQLGKLSIPTMAVNGHYALSSALDLPLIGWIVFGLVCSTPLLWCLIVGLPPKTESVDEAEGIAAQ